MLLRVILLKQIFLIYSHNFWTSLISSQSEIRPCCVHTAMVLKLIEFRFNIPLDTNLLACYWENQNYSQEKNHNIINLG